jgi:3-oxoacyl-[acyl-carrier protein] reductase
MDLGIEGKIALVAASSQGLGRACAEALAAEGARVVVSGRDAEKLERVASEIRDEVSAEVHPVASDLGSAEGVEQLVAGAVEKWGRVDILVHNSGGPPPGAFWDLADEDWRRAFELVNLSAIRLVRALAPGMRERGWGRIVGIQSSAVKQPVPHLDLSNGVRPGVPALFKALMPELAPDGVTINTVLPGVFRTARIEAALGARAEKANRSLEAEVGALAASIPAGRLGRSEELAALVAFLASERASYINGAVYQVDGGSIAGVL